MVSEDDAARTRRLDGVAADIADVEAALTRLEADTYFTCEVCGTDLDADLLAAQPTVRRCVGCS